MTQEGRNAWPIVGKRESPIGQPTCSSKGPSQPLVTLRHLSVTNLNKIRIIQLHFKKEGGSMQLFHSPYKQDPRRARVTEPSDILLCPAFYSSCCLFINVTLEIPWESPLWDDFLLHCVVSTTCASHIHYTEKDFIKSYKTGENGLHSAQRHVFEASYDTAASDVLCRYWCRLRLMSATFKIQPMLHIGWIS